MLLLLQEQILGKLILEIFAGALKICDQARSLAVTKRARFWCNFACYQF